MNSSANAPSSSINVPSIRWDSALIKRHDLSGPRYTSYPTALQFDDSQSAGSLLADAKKSTDINPRCTA